MRDAVPVGRDCGGSRRRSVAGIVGAVVGFGFALLWAIFGFWRTLFILLLTLAGYIVGARFFRNSTHFRELIDKFLPPGRFR